MTDTKWFWKGKWLEYCSCDWGCPCESNAPPSRGHCDGAVAMHIDEGYYGDVKLDGITIVATFFFPRALHHKGGHMQPILPASTTPEQRDAIFKIMSGEGQPPNSLFPIFHAVVETIHEPQFTEIVFEWDIDKRTARIDVPGIVRARTEPIRNPVTDEEQRIVLVLPKGWTFYECEGASGTVKGIGAIKLDYANRHSSLAYFAFNNNGMAYSYEEAKKKLGTRV
jgi:hypothetical protein